MLKPQKLGIEMAVKNRAYTSNPIPTSFFDVTPFLDYALRLLDWKTILCIKKDVGMELLV